MIYYGKELYHHGIKGQKWGVRRYQNEDGSYTAEGASQNGGHGRYANTDDSSVSNYKSGLRKATLTGGLIGRAMYKKQHSSEANAIKQQRAQAKADKEAAKKKRYLEYNKKIRDAENEINEAYKNTSYSEIGKRTATEVLIGAAAYSAGRLIESRSRGLGAGMATEFLKTYGTAMVIGGAVQGAANAANKYSRSKNGYNTHKYSVSDTKARERYSQKTARSEQRKAQQEQRRSERRETRNSDYERGLRRATLEGGLVGRAMYKRKNKR